ncbi:MAG: NAD+ synthase [Thermodesulfobacteriota bacterium]
MRYKQAMKIAIAQINPVVGDFGHNAGRMRFWIDAARRQGCDLVVLPELALAGYPPQDLLERPAFLESHDAALRQLITQEHGIGVLCGVIERSRRPQGKPLHNSALLFEDGRILFSAAKRLLPVYDVFDESRYFEPGAGSPPCLYKGLRLGITICEDIWNDPTFFRHQLYLADPVAELAAAPGGLDLLVNIAASPFHRGKYRSRQEMLANACRSHRLPLIYCNQVGGQDSLLFDGRSLALDATGAVQARATDFAEDMVVWDSTTGKGDLHPVLQNGGEDEAAAVLAALVMGTRDYAHKCGFRQGVLGLSGGVDSAVTAAVAARALGPENVLGVALPSPYTSAASLEDAAAVAANLGLSFEVIPISGVLASYLETLPPRFAGPAHDVAEQNIQARIRGNLLMAIANRFGHLLLSTGNKSEMAVGYCTLYGDMSGGLAVISDVPKMLVYRLARLLNREGPLIPERVLSRAPSAELKPSQTDQDDLPPYEILDPICAAYLEENRSRAEIAAMGFPAAVVADVINRINRNEYKRKQAPIGLKVTSKAFGSGRRYPNACRCQENEAGQDGRTAECPTRNFKG